MQSLPIVLLHGWGFSPAVWSPLIDTLVQAGVSRDRLLTPVLPLSAGPSPEDALRALASQLPERSHLVGWSLGGEFALALAQTLPERVASVTLIASTPCFMNRDDWTQGQPSSLLDDFDARLSTNPAALLKRFSMLIRHGDAEASRDRALTEALGSCYESDPNRLATGLHCLRQIDLRAKMPAMATPCMIIHGTHDAVVPISAATWVQQQIGASLHPIEGASHALPLTHTRELADLLRACTFMKGGA